MRSVKRVHWTFLAVLLGAALLWLAVRWDSRPERSASEPEEPAAAVIEDAPALPAAPRAAESRDASTTLAPPKEPPSAPQPAPKPSAAPAHAPHAEAPPPVRSGPVEEMQQRFANEPRDAAASQVEATIQSAFRLREVPAGLLTSVTCRATVCRVETRWSPERAQGFLSALMQLMAGPMGHDQLEPPIAVDPGRELGSDGSRVVDVYLQRKTIPAAEP